MSISGFITIMAGFFSPLKFLLDVDAGKEYWQWWWWSTTKLEPCEIFGLSPPPLIIEREKDLEVIFTSFPDLDHSSKYTWKWEVSGWPWQQFPVLQSSIGPDKSQQVIEAAGDWRIWYSFLLSSPLYSSLSFTGACLMLLSIIIINTLRYTDKVEYLFFN